MAALVADPAEVASIASAIAGAPLVAFDLEFLAQDRLIPTLCLVQVAWPHDPLDAVDGDNVSEPHVHLIDPLAADVRPVIDALAAHACAIVHGGRQDIALLAMRFGVAMPNVMDTQVMAAFAGIGEQIGFASLANELLGTALDKGNQWTDWAQRPLSDAQLHYADADVRHLPAIYRALAARLGPRLAWARAESGVVAADALAATQITPASAWRNVGGLRGLDAETMSAVMALAAWRHRVAVELDRPLGQVLGDRQLVELARQRSASADDVRDLKGLAPVARKRAEEITRAIAARDPAIVAAPVMWRAPSQRAQRWSEVLFAIVQLVAEQTGVAARLLATRADAEELARVVDERGLEAARSLPALSTWRREILGEHWVGWLSGALVLVGDTEVASGLRLVPR